MKIKTCQFQIVGNLRKPKSQNAFLFTMIADLDLSFGHFHEREGNRGKTTKQILTGTNFASFPKLRENLVC